jgi:hypothetical protein
MSAIDTTIDEELAAHLAAFGDEYAAADARDAADGADGGSDPFADLVDSAADITIAALRARPDATIDEELDAAARACCAAAVAAHDAARAAGGGDAPEDGLDEGERYHTAADFADTAARVAYAASTDERPALAAMRDLLADGAALPTALRAYRAATYIEPTPFDDERPALAVAALALASAIDDFNAAHAAREAELDEAPPWGDPDDEDFPSASHARSEFHDDISLDALDAMSAIPTLATRLP